ncbi:MAG: hypothetical protein U0237_04235 [Thermoleophilia bacterium]
MDPTRDPREDESGQTTQTSGQPPLPDEDGDEDAGPARPSP